MIGQLLWKNGKQSPRENAGVYGRRRVAGVKSGRGSRE